MNRHGRFCFVTMISPIPATINHLLAREPWARERLARHAGKVALFDAGVVSIRLKAAADGLLQAVLCINGDPALLQAAREFIAERRPVTDPSAFADASRELASL